MRWSRSVHFILLIAFLQTISSDDANIVKVWESSKEWSKYFDWNRDVRQCEMKEVCPVDSTNCGDKVRWRKFGQRLKNSAEVVVIDDKTFNQASFNHNLQQMDLDNLKDHLCDMTLIKRRNKRCWIFWIPNQCPWEPFMEEAWPFSKDCDVKTINTEDNGSFPADCRFGSGWKGNLETFVEDDSYKIKWASLFKRPACVEYIALIDKKGHQRKRFITTLSDVNFPIEYKKNTCDLKIKVKMRGTESCFVTNAAVKCENDPDQEEGFSLVPRGGFPDRKPDSSGTMIVAIICATVFSVSVVTAITLIILKKRTRQRAEQQDQVELNDRYGTYYHGVEYSIASDDNPRYNKDGGNADAVVTDENVYYQLGPDVPGGSGESDGSCGSLGSGGFGGYHGL